MLVQCEFCDKWIDSDSTKKSRVEVVRPSSGKVLHTFCCKAHFDRWVAEKRNAPE